MGWCLGAPWGSGPWARARRARWLRRHWAGLSRSKQLIRNIRPNDVSIIFVHWRKMAKWPTLLIHQSRRKTWQQMPAHTINVTFTDGIRRRVCSTLHQSVTCQSLESRIVTSINSNVMLLQQFLLTIRQISHETSGQCRSTQGTWSNPLFPHNFAKCWAISKILSKQTQQ